MSIEFHCESCSRLIKAPQEAAGKRGQCPYCGKSVYVPMPEAELDELPLAPDDDADRRRQEALQAERRRLDRILAQQTESPDSEPRATSRSKGGSSGTSASADSLEDAVVGYLNAMRNSELVKADNFLAVLQRRGAEARTIIDRLAADQIPPPGMTGVPPGVYQGFLKTLRSQL